MMRELFLGPWRYWLLWLVVVAVLFGLGRTASHVHHFVPFSFAVLALAAVVIAVVLATYRKDERVTREPFDEVAGDE